MENLLLYTIGYGNRKTDEFLTLLKSFCIECLIDVRSEPYSKYNPLYNQNRLKIFLEENKISYIFMGDSIGGRPVDKSCYNYYGKIDYELVKTKDFFKKGIKELKALYKNANSVLMCSEWKPHECHRSKLIGKVLAQENIFLKHIDEKGKLIDQISVMNQLNKGFGEYDLFGNPIN